MYSARVIRHTTVIGGGYMSGGLSGTGMLYVTGHLEQYGVAIQNY